jgi:AhpD family alkylhydroperoxidase
MIERNFPRFDETTAPAAARAALAETKRRFGAIPEPVSRHASSPALLLTALGGLDALEKITLTRLEREVLAMTMGVRNGCRFCVELHTRLLVAQKADRDLVSALRAGQPLGDERLEALRRFVLAMVEHSGDSPPEDWARFVEAGYTHEQALEVVLGIGVYTMTTLANRLTETSE